MTRAMKNVRAAVGSLSVLVVVIGACSDVKMFQLIAILLIMSVVALAFFLMFYIIFGGEL